MLDDIKEAVESFRSNNKMILTSRDEAGIIKIQAELDLLKRLEKPTKERKSVKKALPVDQS